MNIISNEDSSKYRSARRANIKAVCKFMGWPRPRYISSGNSGYICRWSSQPFVCEYGVEPSYRAVAKIYSELNINCRLTSAGHLIIPFAEEVQE